MVDDTTSAPPSFIPETSETYATAPSANAPSPPKFIPDPIVPTPPSVPALAPTTNDPLNHPFEYNKALSDQASQNNADQITKSVQKATQPPPPNFIPDATTPPPVVQSQTPSFSPPAPSPTAAQALGGHAIGPTETGTPQGTRTQSGYEPDAELHQNLDALQQNPKIPNPYNPVNNPREYRLYNQTSQDTQQHVANIQSGWQGQVKEYQGGASATDPAVFDSLPIIEKYITPATSPQSAQQLQDLKNADDTWSSQVATLRDQQSVEPRELQAHDNALQSAITNSQKARKNLLTYIESSALPEIKGLGATDQQTATIQNNLDAGKNNTAIHQSSIDASKLISQVNQNPATWEQNKFPLTKAYAGSIKGATDDIDDGLRSLHSLAQTNPEVAARLADIQNFRAKHPDLDVIDPSKAVVSQTIGGGNTSSYATSPYLYGVISSANGKTALENMKRTNDYVSQLATKVSGALAIAAGEVNDPRFSRDALASSRQIISDYSKHSTWWQRAQDNASNSAVGDLVRNPVQNAMVAEHHQRYPFESAVEAGAGAITDPRLLVAGGVGGLVGGVAEGIAGRVLGEGAAKLVGGAVSGGVMNAGIEASHHPGASLGDVGRSLVTGAAGGALGHAVGGAVENVLGPTSAASIPGRIATGAVHGTGFMAGQSLATAASQGRLPTWEEAQNAIAMGIVSGVTGAIGEKPPTNDPITAKYGDGLRVEDQVNNAKVFFDRARDPSLNQETRDSSNRYGAGILNQAIRDHGEDKVKSAYEASPKAPTVADTSPPPFIPDTKGSGIPPGYEEVKPKGEENGSQLSATARPVTPVAGGVAEGNRRTGNEGGGIASSGNAPGRGEVGAEATALPAKGEQENAGDNKGAGLPAEVDRLNPAFSDIHDAAIKAAKYDASVGASPTIKSRETAGAGMPGSTTRKEWDKAYGPAYEAALNARAKPGTPSLHGPENSTANVAEENTQTRETPAVAPTANNSIKPIQKALDDYDEGENGMDTVGDVVNHLDGIVDDAPPEVAAKIRDAIDKHREEAQEDRKLSGRGDMDTADEEFLDTVQKAIKQEKPNAIQEQSTGESSVRNGGIRWQDQPETVGQGNEGQGASTASAQGQPAGEITPKPVDISTKRDTHVQWTDADGKTQYGQLTRNSKDTVGVLPDSALNASEGNRITLPRKDVSVYQPPQFRPGDEVINGTLDPRNADRPGKIVADNGDGTYHVLTGTDRNMLRVPGEQLRPVNTPETSKSGVSSPLPETTRPKAEEPTSRVVQNTTPAVPEPPIKEADPLKQAQDNLADKNTAYKRAQTAYQNREITEKQFAKTLRDVNDAQDKVDRLQPDEERTAILSGEHGPGAAGENDPNFIANTYNQDLGTSPIRRAIQNVKDALTTDVIPKLFRAGVGPEAVAHAKARDAVAPKVRNMLAKVFPDSYKNPEEMAKTIDILNKDNILSGYDEFYKKAEEAKRAGNTKEQNAWIQKAENIEKSHDINQIENDVLAAKDDPKVSANIKRWKAIVNPELDRLYNEMKRLDANEPQPERGKIFGARINLVDENSLPEWQKALKDGEQPLPQQSSASSYRNPNVKKDSFDQTAKFTGKYATDAETVLSSAIARRLNETTKLRLIDKLQRQGVAWEEKPGKAAPKEIGGEPVERLPIRVPQTELDPAREDFGNTKIVEKSLFVQKHLAGELMGVLGLRNKEEMPVLQSVGRVLNAVQLAGVVDFAAHGANLERVVSNALGEKSDLADVLKKLPLVGSAGGIGRVAGVLSEIYHDTPAIREELSRMADAGLLRGYQNHAWWQKTGEALQHVDTGVRVVMNRYFDNLVDRKMAEDSPENRFRFVSQAGEYSRRLVGPVTRIMRDAGMSPFVIAGRTFNRMGRRWLTGNPGFASTSNASALKSRALMVAGVVAAVAIPMMINAALSGDPLGRPGVPLGAVDTGKTDVKGNPVTWDLLQLNGARRGANSLGLTSLVEGLRQGKDFETIAANMFRDIGNTVAHPWSGPAPAFTFKTLTGKQPDLRGKMDAQKIPGVEEESPRQLLENARAAAESQNPLIYGFLKPWLQKSGIDSTPKEAFGESSLIGGAIKPVAGALGIKSSPKAADSAEDLAARFARDRYGSDGVTAEENDKIKINQELLQKIKEASNKDSAQQIISDAVGSGEINNREAANLSTKASLSPLEWNIRSLSPEQAASVYDKATDSEKAQIGNAVAKKIEDSKELTDDQKNALYLNHDITPPIAFDTDREYKELSKNEAVARKISEDRKALFAQRETAIKNGDLVASDKIESQMEGLRQKLVDPEMREKLAEYWKIRSQRKLDKTTSKQ